MLKFKMMNLKKISSLVLLFGLISLLIACNKKKQEEEEPEVQFDKTGMLTNYADNVLIPNFQSAKNALDSFALAYNDFTQSKSEADLIIARQKFIAAYARFQYISAFELGPSETELVRLVFNTYPCDSVQIKNNISAGTYDFTIPANIAAHGYPAIDYLLFGKNISNASLIALFDTDANATNRKAYITNCVTEMQTKLNNIIASWSSGYKSTFINSTGSDIGSSLGLLVNQLNYEVDFLKNFKIGTPLGKKTLGTPLPDKCEAYYANQYSVILAKECLNNIENMYLGRSRSGADGLGLDDYLDALKAEHISGSLNNAIKTQFGIAKTKLALVNEPLSDAVINNAAVVDAAYLEIQKLLVLLKTDMPSVMGIIITYQDGDGD